MSIPRGAPAVSRPMAAWTTTSPEREQAASGARQKRTGHQRLIIEGSRDKVRPLSKFWANLFLR